MAMWIAFGIALSASALVLAWRRLRRTFAETFTKYGRSKAARTLESTGWLDVVKRQEFSNET
jgi:hypothetical protein